MSSLKLSASGFCTSALLFYILVCLSISYGTNAQEIDKKPYFPNGLTEATPLGPYLPKAKFQLFDDASTSACYYEGGTDECAKRNGKWSAKSARYEDLESPITICVCSGVDISINTIADGYSQVPQFMRKIVKSVAFVPQESRSAYNQADHIVVFAKNVDKITNLYIHESAHSHDKGFSATPDEWRSAVSKDTCVPDSYAQQTYAEDYAQNLVVFIYKLWRPNDPPSIPDCMKNQQNAILMRGEAGLQEYIKERQG